MCTLQIIKITYLESRALKYSHPLILLLRLSLQKIIKDEWKNRVEEHHIIIYLSKKWRTILLKNIDWANIS
jgi:hypothetical protein